MNKIYLYLGIVFAAFLAFLKAVSMGKDTTTINKVEIK